MIPRLLCLLFCWDFAVHLGRAQKLPGVKKASLKVQINATSDTVVLKFLRPTPNINLEGFILGYGSSFFSTQYIPLPENGNSYDTELDAEPRYLVAVRPSPIVNAKKTCSAQNKVQKPLQVVVGTLTPTSVYLAWGVLVNPQNDWTVLNKCPTDRFYTVRYREKEKNKKWNFQLCPSTETVVDNLKPNIIYEFGVKDNSEDGTWNKGVTHKTTVPPKHKNGGNGHIQNTYPKGHIQEAPEDTKMLVPVTVIKQVVQNISNGKKTKSTVSSALPTSTATIERQPGSRNPPEHTNPKKLQGPLAQTESEVEPSKFHVSTTPGLPLTTLAANSVDQETTGPIISNALQLLGTTLAVNDMQPLPAILATSEVPETAKATAVNQMSPVPPTTKIYISTEHPESTLVSNELPLFIPTMGTTSRTGKQFTDPVSTESPLSLSGPEPPEESEESELVSNELPLFIPTMGSSARTEKQITDTVKHQFTQGIFTTLSSATTKQTKSALVSTEPPLSPSEPEPSEESELEESELVSHRINPEVLKTVFSLTPERPNSTPAALPKTQEPFKYEQILSTEHSDSETATRKTTQETLLSKTLISTEQSEISLAKLQVSQEPLTKEAFITTDQPDSELASHDITQEPQNAKAFIPEQQTFATLATHQITEGPLKVNEIVSTDKTLASHEMTQEPQRNKVSSTTEQPDSSLATHQITEGPLKANEIVSTDKTPASHEMTQEHQDPQTTKASSPTEKADSIIATLQVSQEPPVIKTDISTDELGSTLATHPIPEESPSTIKIVSTEQTDKLPAAKFQSTHEPSTVKAFISTDEPDSNMEEHYITQEPHKTKLSVPIEQPDESLVTQQPIQENLTTRMIVFTKQPDTTPAANLQTTQESHTIKAFISTEQPDSIRAAHHTTQESSTTKISISAVQPDATTEVRQMTQEPRTDIPDISPTQPDSTPVSNEATVLASKEDTASISEIHQSKTATTKPKTPELIIPKSQPEEQPKTTLDLNKTPFISSESKVYEKPETPQTDPVRWTSQKPLTPKPSRRFRRPKTTLGPKDSFFIPPKLSTSAKPDVLQREPGPRPTQRVPINLIRLHFTEDPGVTLVPNEIHELPSAKPKAAQTTQRALPTPVSKKTQRVPINLIHLHIIEDPDTTPVPNETSKAKTVHPTERPQSKDVPKSTHRVPINLIRLHIFEDPSVTLVPSETQKTSSKPTSQTTELPHVKADSEDFHTKTTKPKILTARPRPHTTQAPRKVHPSSSRPKTSARPRTRPVPNRTTQATALPKSSNDLNWISETAVGAKLTGQDVTKLLGVSRNTSTEPNGTVKRPNSGSSLPPPRPTHMRRRPFPPNNVTGRPGIAGNGLMPRSRSSSSRYMPRPTQVAIMERTQPPKPRTTSAPEMETGTEPVFNASPVSDVDPVGKPRYTAPHVKYMRKEDLVPCSITESMRHFPTEMGANEDEATIAPQNPPSNLTVVAVEGCPSFVILDWEQPNNDTVTEYKVISKENGGPTGKDQSILTTNQTHSTVENLKPDTSYEFKVIATNVIGEGPPSTTVTHNTESADPRVSEPITGGKDAIWTEIKFKSDTYSECKGKQYVKRTWYKKFVGIQLCNSLRYKIYLSDSLSGKFYNIGDESGYGEDHCQFVDSFLDGRTGQQLYPDQLPTREGFYRSVRQQPVDFGKIGSHTHIRYVHWYECGTTIPGKW